MKTTEDIIQDKLTNQLKSAYRKCKTTMYYDSYGSIQRMDFANFEREPLIFETEYKIDDFFKELARIIMHEDEFEKLVDFICDKIDVIAFPKHMAEEEKAKEVIRNFHLKNFKMDRLHYFIDLPIIGHILGVLWILRCGYLLDDKLYKNCYGNRLNKYLLERLRNKKSDYYVANDCMEFSPFLFNPYYQNYQSWRDNGLESVNKLLEDKKNAIMISLDLKEYFHRSLIDFAELENDLIDTRKYINEKFNYSSENSAEEEYNVRIDKFLTGFIEKVFNTYSNKFERKYSTKAIGGNKRIDTKRYPMIPVGFSPSLIISNWNLQGFDQAIVENVRPHYYGRYVDDILIVLGSHEKSESHGLQQIEEKTFDELIERYLTDEKNYPKTHIFKNDKRRKIYRIYNQSFKNSKGREITYHYEGLEIQDNKLKTYFFSHKYSNAMIENFKNEIRKNSSEFRLMHDMDSIKQDFKENLYKINYKESVNKIRDINNVDVNKFEISKILSRINWISSDTTDNIDDELIKNMVDAFKGKIFDYITLWDKLFTLLVLNNKYEQLRDLIRYIQKNIGNITFTAMKGNSYKYLIRDVRDAEVVKISLMRYLYSNLSRVFSLKYNAEVKNVIDDIKFDFGFDLNINFANQISNYLYSSMQNTSFMRYPLQDLSYIFDDFDETTEFNLVKQKNSCKGLFNGFCYPRFIKLHECILHTINNELFCDKNVDKGYSKKYPNIDEELLEQLLELKGGYLEESFDIYKEKNFKKEKDMYEDYIAMDCGLDCSKGKHCPLKIYDETQFKDVNIIKVKGKRKGKIKVGLFNTNLDYNDFERRILGKPNLSSKRFDKIKILINDAIKKNVDLLVMPEMHIPYEWIENIVKVSKDHQMAIIFGVEPIEHNDEIGNYIMMAMPFIFNDKYHECAIMYRPKNHYSPEEMRQFERYEKKIRREDEGIAKYCMCIWNDIHIVPYCSYEIASVDDRSIFKSCCDIVTVSEFNRDTTYINGIAESLSRDLFCYCIKSNVSGYGGSCIIQPTSSNDNYLINLKGGEDDYIVTHDLDIGKLRKSAIQSDKVRDTSNFGPKPPGFWKNNVKERY